MNSFGRIFKISIFGESHGKNIGVTIDGCPSGIEITEDSFHFDLSRRRSGARGTTPRKEPDKPQIISGVFKNLTTGAPLTIIFENTNTISKDYTQLLEIPRPGHADFVAQKKYLGFQDYTGGGHFSGRLTLGLVAAGVIAKRIIHPMLIQTEILEVGGSKNIEEAVEMAVNSSNSIGGLIECTVRNMPIGLGEPFFDSIEAVISHMVFSIPAIKGIEFGSGFGAAKMKGSEHNDLIIDKSGKTLTNNAGGINGGISNGNDLVFRIAVKPTSSIGLPQETINLKTGQTEKLKIEGRHDACIALRIPVVLEAATSIVLADLLAVENSRKSFQNKK
jgi:chorismate synthase